MSEEETNVPIDEVEINPQYYIHITITQCINSVYNDLSKFIYGVNLLGSILVANKTITPQEWDEIKKKAEEEQDKDSELNIFMKFNKIFQELLTRAFDTRADESPVRT